MTQYRYDIFIAHSSVDTGLAEHLYDQLVERVAVFLDTRCLTLGDEWDIVIPQAQMSSRVTVVLVSSNTESAYYARDEIRSAINLARSHGERHRVVPVFTTDAAISENGAHYGLRLKHGIVMNRTIDLPTVANKLVTLVQSLPTSGDASEEAQRPEKRHSSINPRQVSDRQAMTVIQTKINTAATSRLSRSSAIVLLQDSFDLTAPSATTLIELLLLRKYLTSASGNRVEISLLGFNLLTQGERK